MRAEKDIKELMDVIKPYLEKISKDMDEDVNVQFFLAPDGNGWAIVKERNKDMNYYHYVDLVGCKATNWRVEHECAFTPFVLNE